MKILFLAIIVTALLTGGVAFAGDEVRVGRYSSIKAIPTIQQTDPLQTVINTSFGVEVTTVGEAIGELLDDSGYRMASLKASDPNLPILLHAPLPGVHRNLGPIPLITALEVLAGGSWVVVIDRVYRLVSYDLKPQFDSM